MLTCLPDEEKFAREYCALQGVDKPFRRATLALCEWTFYRKLCLEKKPRKVLEIGSFIYASTCAFLSAMETLPEMLLYSLDVMQERAGRFTPRNFEVAKRFFRIQARSQDYMPHCCDMFDIILCDGGHQPHNVTWDFENGLKLLNDGGTIIMHDMKGSNIQKAILDKWPETRIETAHCTDHRFGLGIYTKETA